MGKVWLYRWGGGKVGWGPWVEGRAEGRPGLGLWIGGKVGWGPWAEGRAGWGPWVEGKGGWGLWLGGGPLAVWLGREGHLLGHLKLSVAVGGLWA